MAIIVIAADWPCVIFRTCSKTSPEINAFHVPEKPALPRSLLLFCLITIFGMIGFGSAFGLDFERLQQALFSRFGPGSAVVYTEWKQLVEGDQKLPETEKLKRVNDFFNQRIVFNDDIVVWGQNDYWATPMETIGRGAGDCEDFSIAKYYSLTSLGVPVSKLRLIYVKALQGGSLRAHMVLAYYSTPNADPLVLDNLNPQILPASRRQDLSPIFSFNSAGLWRGTGNQTSSSSLSRWQDLLTRARNEGFQ